ncbi:MAG TPA: HAMP domain-containing sensor histidine kinase [Paenibacillus sp.]
MINKIWSVLNGKRSIRVQMLWAGILSLILTSISRTILDFLRPLFPDAFFEFSALALFFASFIFFFFVLTSRTVRYFRVITDGLQSIAGGNLKYRIPLSRQDELGNVAHNINHMAEQLQQQMEKERQIEQSKMELITYVSHDLRTPLTSIIGYLDLLKTPKYHDEAEQARFINNAYNKTQQLKKLIDDLFEYTRLTNGDVRLSFQEVDYHSLLKQIISEFEPVANEQQITIVQDISPLPLLIHMDIEKMVRTIDNLLTNALKFSIRPGEIKVQLTAQEEHVILSVENVGKPISLEQERQLFERFYKMEPSRYEHNTPAGSGLGLSIAKHIVELHGGRIWLEHHEGHYKFCIEINKTHSTI